MTAVESMSGTYPPAAPPEGRLIERRAQIDGLRALAMAGVLYVHTWNDQPLFEHIRVSLFFVVSGFLITSILMTARDRGGRINVMNFYVRRLLRLMPPLIVLICFAWIFDIDGFRGTAHWHVLQASNIYFALNREFQPWIVSQLWSLNVLEQFYLIWPPVILLLSMARIYIVTLALFASMVTFRVNMWAFGLDYWAELVVMTDPIAVGALFCLLFRVASVREVIVSRGSQVASCALLASPLVLGQVWANSESYRVLMQPALAALVCGAFAGWRGPIGAALESRAARFLSQISYGVFIDHFAVWWAIGETWFNLYTRGPAAFLAVSAGSVAVAWLSWVLMERPIAGLKRHFPTAGPAAGPA